MAIQESWHGFDFRRPRQASRARKRGQRVDLYFEALESRCTPAIAVQYSAGALLVDGDSEANRITISAAEVAGIKYLLVNEGSTTVYDGRPTARNTRASALQSIRVDGKTNNDFIDLALVTTANGFTNIANRVTLLGGDGNDTLVGSAFADKLYGGNGQDRFFTTAGNDLFEGGAGADVFMVTNKNDAGPGSLRAALTSANATPNVDFPDEVHFAIAGTTLHRISLTTALPTLTDAIVINGATQAGFNQSPRIEIDGSLIAGTANGLRLNHNSTLKSLSIYGFSGSGVILSGNGNRITGSFIGLSGDFVRIPGNGAFGIQILGNSNTIGGSTWAERNVISGNVSAGVAISGLSASGNYLWGNYIGLNANLTGSTNTQGTGVLIDQQAHDNIIGQTSWQQGMGNVIGGNRGDGILITGAGTSNNVVSGNQIGVKGVVAIGNLGAGVRIVNASQNIVGQLFELGLRDPFGLPNTIAYNRDSGVVVDGGNGNAIVKDYIFSNDWGDSVQPSDIDLLGTGNNSQPAPIVTAAVLQPLYQSTTPTVLVTYYVPRFQSGVDPGPLHVEFYLKPQNAASRTYLGSAWYHADNGEAVTIALSLPANVSFTGASLLAIATGVNSNSTSEVSAAKALAQQGFTLVADRTGAITATSLANSPATITGRQQVHNGNIDLRGNAQFVINNSRYVHSGQITLSDSASMSVIGGQFIQKGAITLSGTSVLSINAAHWIQMYADNLNGASSMGSGSITLRGSATLVIVGSVLEIRQLFSQQNFVEVEDDARIVIRNSEIMTDNNWMNWNFHDNADFTLDHVDQEFSSVWHGFVHDTTRNAQLLVNDSAYRGTFGGRSVASINGAPETFIEYVFPDRQWLVEQGLSRLLSPTGRVVVDEALPAGIIDNYRFTTRTNADGTAVTVGTGLDFGIPYDVSINDSYASAWGITVRSGMDVTIRDGAKVVVTLNVSQYWNGTTATFSDLNNVGGQWVEEKLYNQSWTFGPAGNNQTKLNLLNTVTYPWSPIVADYSGDSLTNRLVINDSYLADNSFSNGYGIVEMNRSSASYVRGRANMTFTLVDTEVREDLVALGYSTISMSEGTAANRDSRVGGDVVAGDNSRVRLVGTDVGGNLSASGDAYVWLENLSVGSSAAPANVVASGTADIHLTGVEVWGQIIALNSTAKIYLHGYTANDPRLHGGIAGSINTNVFFV